MSLLTDYFVSPDYKDSIKDLEKYDREGEDWIKGERVLDERDTLLQWIKDNTFPITVRTLGASTIHG